MPIFACSFDLRPYTFCLFEPVTPFYEAKNYGMLTPTYWLHPGRLPRHSRNFITLGMLVVPENRPDLSSSDSLCICCRSAIHGRGLFCKRNIEAGEMVIEYAGIVIRSVLTDKREKYYDSKVGRVSVSLIVVV